MSSTQAHPEFQVVRFKSGKLTLEVLTKPGAVTKYRKGQLGLDNVLVSEEIFKQPYNKGEKPKENELKDALGTEVLADCIKLILEKGELQLTAAERREKVDLKKSEIVNYIHKYYIDPRSKTPHPVVRIEAALEEIKAKIDADTPAERQIADILKKLPDVLPIKKCEIRGILTVPNKHVGSVMGVLSKLVSVEKESYNADGCVMTVSLVPGDYDILLSDLQKVTKGEFQFDIEGQEALKTADEVDAAKGKGKGKGKGKK